MATYTNPVVFSEDLLCIGMVQQGDVFPPALIPVSAQKGNLLRVAEDGLIATADGLISQETDNILVPGAVGLYADMEKAVAENDKVLSVADNKVRSTLSLEFTRDSDLILRGIDGVVVGSVRLPVVPGLPVIVEYLGDVTPPAGSVVIGGVVGQTGNYLHMRFLLNDDTLQDVFINFAKIFNLNIGNGLAFTSTGAVVVRPATGGGVIVDENGVSVSADYIRKVAEIVVAGAGQPLPGGGIVTDAATGMLKLDCGVVRDCVEDDSGLAASLIKPGGGLTTDSQGRLAVSCSAITPCIQGVVDTAVGDIPDELAQLKTSVQSVNTKAETAQAQAATALEQAGDAADQSAAAVAAAASAQAAAELSTAKAEEALGEAAQAQTTADTALTKAEQALASEPDLSGYLSLTGGTLTGALSLPAVNTPTDTQAVPYKYIQDNFLAQNAGILTALEETATEAQGTADLALEKAEQALASEPDLSGYLPTTGGEITGPLLVTSPTDIDYEVTGAVHNVGRVEFRSKHDNRAIGILYDYIDADGANHLALRVLSNTASGSGVHLEIVKKLDGTAYALSAATPTGATGNEIVVASWANDKYLPLAGGTLSGSLAIKSENIDQENPPAQGLLWSRRIALVDASGENLAWLDAGRAADYVVARLSGFASGSATGSISIKVHDDGTVYGDCPHPRSDNYGQDIVTTKALKDYAIQRVGGNLNIYVGGANASDTADLLNGRGLSPDKPFAGLFAAMLYVASTYAGSGVVYFNLQGAVTWNISSYACYLPGMFNRYVIQSTSASELQTINLNKPFVIGAGNVVFTNVKFQATKSMSALVVCDSSHSLSHMELASKIEFVGTVTVGTVIAENGGTVVIDSTVQLSGTVDGPRYACKNGGRILTNGSGADFIPGSAAGTVATGGQYI